MFEITMEKFLEMYKLKPFAFRAISKFNLKFPISPNGNLAKIVSYLTFDGHLSLTQQSFLLGAGRIDLLKPFERAVYEQFKIKGKIRKMKDNFGTSYEYRVSNNPVKKILYLLGTPNGSKVKNKFLVPSWILKNKKLSKQYLQIAFDCEGSVWKEKDNRIRIGFIMAKSSLLLENGIDFLSQMRKMLEYFDINSTSLWITEGDLRKDGVRTKFIRFNIKDKDVIKFRDRIGFLNKDKAEKFDSLLGL